MPPGSGPIGTQVSATELVKNYDNIFFGWDFAISFSLIIIIYVPVPYHFLWHKSSMKENIFSYKVTMEKIRFCVCFSDFSEIYIIRKNLKIKIKDFIFII